MTQNRSLSVPLRSLSTRSSSSPSRRRSIETVPENADQELATHVGLTPSQRLRTPERACFICLDSTEYSDEADSRLVPCCTRCFAVTHMRCWNEWRGSQAGHARRARLSGNRVAADPFICSICKSGSARIHGERVSVQWLEAFAHFSSGVRHPVRFASGLFTALTGARMEASSTTAADDEEDPEREVDFLDFVEDGGMDDTFLCGNNRKFVLVNLLLVMGFLFFLTIVNQTGLIEPGYVIMCSVMVAVVYTVSLLTYIFLRYQRVMNHRRLIGS